MTRWFGRLIPQGKFGRSVTLIAGGTLAGQLVVVAATPVMTRLFLPEHFGALAVYAAIISMLGTVTSMRYEVAIALPEREEDGADVFGLCVVLNALVFVVLGAVALLWGPALLSRMNADALIAYRWLLPVGILGVGLSSAASFWSLRKRAYPELVRSKVGQGVTQVTAQLLCAFAGLKVGGLLIGDVVGRLSAAMLLGRSIWRRDGLQMRRIRWSGILGAARRFRHFPMFNGWSTLCSNASLTLPPVLAAYYFGQSDAGLFSLAQRVIALPTILVGQAISQVYFSEAAVLLRERPDGVSRLLRATVRKLFIFSAGPLILMAVFGPWGARVLLGPHWEQAGAYVRMLAPLCVGQFVVFPISDTLNLLEHQRVHLAWDVARLVTTVSIFAYGAHAGLSATSTTGIYGLAMGSLYGALFVLADRAARRRQGTGQSRPASLLSIPT